MNDLRLAFLNDEIKSLNEYYGISIRGSVNFTTDSEKVDPKT